MERVSDAYVESVSLRRWGIRPKKTGKEWHSPCPYCCEGRDRFIIFDNGGTYCRVCGHTGWLDDDDRKWKPDPSFVEIARQRIEREEQQRLARIEIWQNGFDTGYLIGYHDAMHQTQRDYWISQGIRDELIDEFCLGYCPEKEIDTGVKLPAYTIPICDPRTGKLVNVQYRLVNPPPGVGKYRQEHGIPAANFYATPELSGDVLVVEGSKKAIVLFDFIKRTMPVVGLPGITPHPNLIDELACFSRKWLIPDPGVNSQQIKRFTERLNGVGVVSLPAKIDDAITTYGLTTAELKLELKMARKM